MTDLSELETARCPHGAGIDQYGIDNVQSSILAADQRPPMSQRIGIAAIPMSEWLERNGQKMTVALAAVVFLVGAAYSLHLGDTLRFPDESEHFSLASNLANHQSYSFDGSTPSTFRPPGYALVMSVPLALGADIVALRLLNFGLLGLTIVMVYSIGVSVRGPLAGALAALLVSMYPVLFFTASTLYPQTLATALLVALVALVLRRQLRPIHVAAIGIVIGLLILTVPTSIVVTGLVLLWATFLQRTLTRPQALFVALVAFLIVGSWTARNFAATDHFVPISSNSGINLLLGNSENTEPNSGPTTDIDAYLEAAPPVTDEIARNAYFQQEAIEYIRSHPEAAASLYASKFLNYFNYRNDLHTQSESSSLRDLVMLMSYGPILLLAALRLAAFHFVKLTRIEVMLAAAFLVNGLIDAVFFTRVRYRLPFDVLLILVSASMLTVLLLGLLAQSRSTTTGSKLSLANESGSVE